MCYYNGQKVSRTEFIRLMDLEKAVEHYEFLDRDIHDGFTYSHAAVLKPTEAKNDFNIVPMEWGFLPANLRNREAVERFRNGYKDANGLWHKGFTTLNAKAENLFLNEKGEPSMFRHAAKERRCLLLSTGFYEWRHIYPANKRTGLPVKTAVKYPYYVTLKDKEYFYMAGIWQSWTDEDTGEHVDTLAIITTEANHLMRQVHNNKERMPTILNDALAYEWIMGDLNEARITEIARTQYSSFDMDACSIAKDFLESTEPSTPFEHEGLPALDYNFVDEA
jgi:putative SOS response-associated peptidase YedK